MANIGRRYSFPNVNVTENIIGPQPYVSLWRNKIGVAAPFSKGPILAEISSRQELVSLYGEDRSIGSTFIRQALLQGATNFVVSRVLPTAKKATTTVALQSTTPLVSPAIVNNGIERTVGLTGEFSMIGNPIMSGTYDIALPAPGETVPGEVTTNKEDFLTLDFQGVGYFNIISHNYDEVRGDSDQTTYVIPDAGITIPASSITDGIDGVQLITFAKTATNAATFSKLYPGCKLASNDLVGGLFATPGTVLSHAFSVDIDTWGFFAQVDITTAGNTSLKVTHPMTAVTDDKWGRVFTVTFSGYQGSQLPNAVYLKEDGRDARSANTILTNSQDLQESIIGYFFLGDDKLLSLNDADRTVRIKYIKDIDGVSYELVDTGVDLIYPVGIPLANRAYSVAILKEEIAVGETDTNRDGFPDTPASFQPGTPVDSILDQFKDAIHNNPTLGEILDDIYIDIQTLPYSLTFSVSDPGVFGNNILYKISRVVGSGSPDDINFVDGLTNLYNSQIGMVGGADGTKSASLIIYASDGFNTPLVYLRAISPGNAGNSISVSFKRINKGRFDLEIQEILPGTSNRTALPKEIFTLSNYSVDFATGLYPETLDSKFLRAYYIPAIELQGVEIPQTTLDLSPSRISPIVRDGIEGLSTADPGHLNYKGEAVLRNLLLKGGAEPAEYEEFYSESAYIEAIDRLAEEDVSIISAPGLIAGDIRYSEAINTLIAQAENATPYTGLRIAVLAAPPRLSPTRAELIGQEFNSPRLVVVGGWSNLASNRSLSANNSGPEGIYCGRLATEDTYISPSSSYSGRSIVGVRSVDTTGSLDILETYTNNNIEMLFVDKTTNSVKFLNGRTTAKDLSNRWVAIRRQADHLIMTITANLQWAKSAPNNPETRLRVASACDAVLKTEMRRGAISSHSATLINSSDPLRIAQGYMDIVINWVPVFPADYIDVTINRTISSSFSLYTG